VVSKYTVVTPRFLARRRTASVSSRIAAIVARYECIVEVFDEIMWQ